MLKETPQHSSWSVCTTYSAIEYCVCVLYNNIVSNRVLCVCVLYNNIVSNRVLCVCVLYNNIVSNRVLCVCII